MQILRVCRDWMSITLAFDSSEPCKYLFLSKRPKIMFILRLFLFFFLSILVIKANTDWVKPTKISYFSPLTHCWNNVVNQPFMCQCWINYEIMLSVNRWCVNIEQEMMQHWRCNLIIYEHIDFVSTLFQPTVPTGCYAVTATVNWILIFLAPKSREAHLLACPCICKKKERVICY